MRTRVLYRRAQILPSLLYTSTQIQKQITKTMTPEQKSQIVGQCTFLWVTILSLAAWICGLAATGYCSFVKRNIEFASNSTLVCEALASAIGLETNQCTAMTQNHGVGFYGWQTTVYPENQLECMSYTQYVPSKFLVVHDNIQYFSTNTCITIRRYDNTHTQSTD
jgi:hypothetical protein